MGIEHRFLRYILDEMKHSPVPLFGQIVLTSRNIPARNIYRDNGFTEAEPGLWRSGAVLAADEAPHALSNLEQTIFVAE